MEEEHKSHKTDKLSWPAAVIVASLILGGAYYVVAANKQQSIEKQQQLDLQAQSNQKQQELDAQAEQNKKDYTAKQKSACLDIYKTENSKWNNVTGWSYYDLTDTCYVEYKDNNPKSAAECDKTFAVNLGYQLLYDNLLCHDGKFEKSF